MFKKKQINDLYNQAKIQIKNFSYGELEGLSFFTPSTPMFFFAPLDYIWNFFIYAGSDTAYLEKYMDLPVTSRIVFSFMKPLLEKGYCLYTDHFYTSPRMADLLVDCETGTVGIVRMTRKDMPAKGKEEKLKKGETIAAYRKKLVVLKWKDKKDLCILNTLHDDSTSIVQSKLGKEMHKPKAVANYNLNMGGFDLSDNLMVNFSTARN